ncbi:MAG TPA: SRPBCC domain-containing protein [Holophagaceae bacterium]|jgi:uncharacterized protein YndB with AHSA1/START domain|nr:SRPBCC domain-containing protein [Holophagaceae bacterium]
MAAKSPEIGSAFEVSLTRDFDAPRAIVWKAWTDSARLAQWWGPHGFTNPVCELDLRPGGAILIHMRAPDGTVYPMTGILQELAEPERIIFTSAALGLDGKPLFEVLNTITLAEEGGRTKLMVHARVAEVSAGALPYLAGMEVGWSQSLDRLEGHLVFPARS